MGRGDRANKTQRLEEKCPPAEQRTRTFIQKMLHKIIPLKKINKGKLTFVGLPGFSVFQGYPHLCWPVPGWSCPCKVLVLLKQDFVHINIMEF